MHFIYILLCLFLLTGCIPAPSQNFSPTSIPTTAQATTPDVLPIQATVPQTRLPLPDPIETLIEAMTIPERVGQLFLARLQEDTAVSDLQQFHLGGFVLFADNFRHDTPDTLRQKLAQYQSASKIPLLLAVDEEGGTVVRISSFSAFRDKRFPSPRQAFQQGGLDSVLESEEEKCQLLSSLGINVNLGPVCDLADRSNAFMYQRSLGQDVANTSSFVSSTVVLGRAYKVGTALKHFPGYGNNVDTHTGIAVDSRSLEDFWSADLIPFTAGISSGAECILVSHTIVNAMDNTLPASLSPTVHAFLRHDLGYSGVILTDDLSMQAITDQFGAGEAAVLAVLAGNDLLCSTEYSVQYQAVLDAINEGRIDIDTLNNAVLHVLHWKQSLGLI